MDYILDTHTHTIASGHAYSTIQEMAQQASSVGLQLLGITDHAPQMPGTCHEFYFQNLKVLPREMFGVEMLMGVELNILDFSGHVDMNEYLLKQMDITIASLHGPCIRPGTKEQNTAAFIHAMKNPYINIIGHPDDSRFPVDMEALVLESQKSSVLLELNNSSLNPKGMRSNPKENDIQMLNLCHKYNVPILLGSDSHTASEIGIFSFAEILLKETNFPQELILNYSTTRLKHYVNKYKTSGL